jgi:preprotein translocase subunit SecD
MPTTVLIPTPEERTDVAARASRPGRTLIVFLLVIGGLFAAASAVGSWKPKLGLDLQGGQRITLQAKSTGGGGVTPDKLDEAVGIISNRVNGAGVSESEVSTQGSDIIIVEIPGKPGKDLTDSLGSTAELRFRIVALRIDPVSTQPEIQPVTPTEPTDSSSTSGAPSSGATSGSPSSGATSGSATETTKPGSKPTNTKATGKNRALSGWMAEDTTPPADSASTSGATTTAPETTDPSTTEDPTTTAPSTAPTTSAPTTPGTPSELIKPDLEDISDPYAWVLQFKDSTQATQSTALWQSRLASFDCDNPEPGQPGQIDLPDQPLLACDSDGVRYLLGPSMVSGTDVSDASAGIPQGDVAYAVNVDFNGDGAKAFGDVTSKIAELSGEGALAGSQLAIVLDGEVISAPTNQDPILGGSAQITGGSANPFTQDEAQSLANSLKFGALPLTFNVVNVSDEGPELASNQLDAGIIAGIVGMILVILYCMLYYRGLSVVIIASLLIAGLLTYACVLLLGHAYGFTLTLPGIAGLIVAVGITADSFIVYFERLRDEVRDGRTLRTSVETGWVRARTTILAADAISLLAAVVLYVFAIGVVKGFAFALGLSTVIDVFVVFFFTKPMVTMLSRTRFFGNGHKWSGLDRQHLGMPALKPTPRASGGEA